MRTKVFILGLICLLIASCKKNIENPYSPEPPDTQSLTINYFTASPSQILYKEVSTLSWSVSNAVKVVIDCGIGEVSATGMREVSPAETTIYMLTAYGETETKSKSAKLEVTPRAIVILDRTKWLSNTTDPNNEEAGWGCGYMVWVKNIGNLTAINIQVYARISDAGSHACDKIYSSSYDLPPGEVSGGYTIHWPFDLECCGAAFGATFDITWDD